jgi:4'-phosphopantetheinyl transferase EntD
MIGELLPPGVVAVEAFDDAYPAPLFPGEEQWVARATTRRRREFATARRCAREALAVLGHEPVPIPVGARGAPIWPDGVAGSITHCAGYRAAVLAPTAAFWTVSVDAEPAEPVPAGVLSGIASDEERHVVAGLRADDATVPWDRLLFCAKEAVYKAWFPLTGRWLGFTGAAVTFDVEGNFEARLRVPGPIVGGSELTAFSGQWRVRRGLILTAIAVPRDPAVLNVPVHCPGSRPPGA